MRILAISGSLRRDSYNRRLLTEAKRLASLDIELELWDGLKAMPPFDEDDEEQPHDSVLELRREIADADAVLIATPEYNGSLPGQLKNALDWASRPLATNVLRDKPVAVIGASPSRGGAAQANADARRILARTGAQPIEQRMLVPHAFDQFQADGTLGDQRLRDQLADVLASLISATKADPARRALAA